MDSLIVLLYPQKEKNLFYGLDQEIITEKVFINAYLLGL